VSWTLVGAGALDSTGFYRAPTTSSGPALAVASAGGKADTALVRFVAGGGVVDFVPFGLARTPVTSLGGLYGYSLLPEQDGVLRDLAEIRRRGARVSLNLTNSGACMLDAAGNYSYTRWEACFDAVALPALERITAYGDSGTINDIYLADEPNHPTRWGTGFTQAMVERMAAHSKALFPRIPTSIRAAPEWLARAGIAYVALDGAWAQYRANRGPIADYVRHHADGARRLGLWLAFGLNVLDGGDGSSGIVNSTTNNGSPLYEMTGAELVRYGSAMLAAQPCVVGGFKWDTQWMGRPGNRTGADSLARLAQQQPRDCTQ
jgi:hypothetical protein